LVVKRTIKLPPPGSHRPHPILAVALAVRYAEHGSVERIFL
jgi:hypothetical protein